MKETDTGRSHVLGANLPAELSQASTQASFPTAAAPPPVPLPVRISSSASMAADPKSSTAAADGSTKKWNTKRLLPRLGSDAVSASCAAGMVAPIIYIIDRSIMENASGRNTLANSIKSSLKNLVLRPQSILFSKPVALIFMLYGGTYLTANTLDTMTSTFTNRPASHVTAGTAKFAASSAANVGLCIYKDQVFVKLFGPRGIAPRPVPPASYLLFTLRDCMTIFASFNVPPVLGPYLNSRMGEDMRRRVSGMTLAQFAAPAAIQLFSTPLHLLGLDLYNRSANVTMGDRWAQVRRNWAISAGARICRIVPAFGVGGVVNTKVRGTLMRKLE